MHWYATGVGGNGMKRLWEMKKDWLVVSYCLLSIPYHVSDWGWNHKPGFKSYIPCWSSSWTHLFLKTSYVCIYVYSIICCVWLYMHIYIYIYLYIHTCIICIYIYYNVIYNICVTHCIRIEHSHSFWGRACCNVRACSATQANAPAYLRYAFGGGWSLQS